MCALNDLRRARSVGLVAWNRFDDVVLAREQKRAVVFRQDFAFDDLGETSIAIAPRGKLTRRFDLRPIKRRIGKDQPERMRTNVLLVDLAHVAP